MERKHDLIFCAQCGMKLDGDEIICAFCGYKLAESHPVKKSETAVVSHPVVEIPITPPSLLKVETPVTSLPPSNVVTPVTLPPKVIPVNPPPPKMQQPYTPPVNQNRPLYPQQPYYLQQPVKKGMGALWLILIVLFVILIAGGGTVAFLQYNGSVNIEFLSNIIPSKDSQDNTVADQTRYYVVHSFAIIGQNWNVIISDVIVSRKPNNNEEGAKNQFKKTIMRYFPEESRFFTGIVLVTMYMNYPAAVSGHNSILKSYGRDPKNYLVRTIKVNY